MEKSPNSTSQENSSGNPNNTSKEPEGDSVAPSQINPDETVTVYNTVINNNPNQIATGFNNAFRATSPKDSLVNPLQPRADRDGTIPPQGKADRLHDLDMIFQLGLMEQWGRYVDGELHIPGVDGI